MAPADEPTLPPSVRRRYVLDGEKLVVAIHQHPIVVAEPVATAVVILLLVIGVATNVGAGAGALVDILWWVWFVAVARAVWMVVDWRKQWIIATDKRIMRTYGFIIRKVAMMPLGKVTDMSYHRSLTGRLLGWGTYVMESAGQQQALAELRFIPNPDHNYRALCAQIFGVDDRERVTEVDEDVQESQVWEDEEDVRLYEDIVQVEPGPMRRQGVQPVRSRTPGGWAQEPTGRPAAWEQRRGRAPRNGHDTADLPVVDSRVAQDAEARELLSSWERFAQRYDERPEPGYDDGTSIYRSGDDTLS